MKIFDSNGERVIIRLDNGTVVTVKEEEIVLRYKVGNARKTKKFGYEDLIAMNDLICKIMEQVIDERNELKQQLKNQIESTVNLITDDDYSFNSSDI